MVTGAAGFIGNALARQLHEQGVDVVAIDDFSSGKNREVAPGVPVIECDARDRSALEEILPQSIDALVHCAAQSSGEVSFDDPWDDMTRHLHATMQLLEISVARKVQHFVYTSSMAAYGNPSRLPAQETDSLVPLSFYGAGKAGTENYVRIYCRGAMAYTILRPFSVYGPGQDLANLRQGMISIYLAQLLHTGRIVVKGSLDRFRDFVHIDDAVQAYLSVLKRKQCQGSTLNLCSGAPTSVREVLEALLTTADADWNAVEVIAGTPGDQFGMYGDNSALRELANWAPDWTVELGIGNMWEQATAATRGHGI